MRKISQLKGSFKAFWREDGETLGKRQLKRIQGQIIFSVLIGNDGNRVLNPGKPNLDHKFHCNGSNIIFRGNRVF